MEEEETFSWHASVVASSHSHDYFDDVFLYDELSLEAMNGLEQPWENLHHRSYFLSKLEQIKCDDFSETSSKKVGSNVIPLGTHGIYAEGNIENLSPTIPINIPHTPGKIEKV